MAPERWQWANALTTVAATAPIWVWWYPAASYSFDSVLAGFIGAAVLASGFFWTGLARRGTPEGQAVVRSLVEGRLAPGTTGQAVAEQAAVLLAGRATPVFFVGLAIAVALVAVVHDLAWGTSARVDVGSALVVLALLAATWAQVTLRRRARMWAAPAVGS